MLEMPWFILPKLWPQCFACDKKAQGYVV